MFQLDGKIALVTGASKGIGAAMARALAEFGARVVLSSRKQEAVDTVAGQFKADGLEATGIAANMGSIDEIQSLVDKTIEVYGGLDIVINNAAANPVFGPKLPGMIGSMARVKDLYGKVTDAHTKQPVRSDSLVD